MGENSTVIFQLLDTVLYMAMVFMVGFFLWGFVPVLLHDLALWYEDRARKIERDRLEARK